MLFQKTKIEFINEVLRRILFPSSQLKLPQSSTFVQSGHSRLRTLSSFVHSGFPSPSQCSSQIPSMAGRLPVRLLGRQLQRQSRRHFCCTSSVLDAHNFYMPAMSPTMTEGGISSWKVKPGDSFQPGDVLVEIETDKATMDVWTSFVSQQAPMLINNSGRGSRSRCDGQDIHR